MMKITISEYDLMKEEKETVIVCDEIKNRKENTIVVSQRYPFQVFSTLEMAKSKIEKAMEKVRRLEYFKTKEDYLNLETQGYINGEEMVY